MKIGGKVGERQSRTKRWGALQSSPHPHTRAFPHLKRRAIVTEPELLTPVGDTKNTRISLFISITLTPRINTLDSNEVIES